MTVMPEHAPKDESALRADYDAVRVTAEKFRQQLQQQMQALVDSADISLGFPIESRVKTWESIWDKVQRRSLQLDNIRDLPDLIGVRLIVLFRRDTERLCANIRDAFQVISSEDKGSHLRQDQFGYSSIHMIVRIPKAWLSVPSFASFGELTAEVQVRTVSQHAWAAASHKLQYKNEQDVPLPIRRSIHRVSALLETVDLEFERVLLERETYRTDVDLTSSEPLNTDSLEKVLDSIFPAANKEPGQEGYAFLLWELSEFEVSTVDRLAILLRKHYKEVMEEEKGMVTSDTVSSARVKEKGVYFVHAGLARRAMRLEFGKRWDEFMQQAYRQEARKREAFRKGESSRPAPKPAANA